MPDATLRAAINRHFLDTGRAPQPAELAARTGVDIADIDAALERLAKRRSLVLRKRGREILTAHPFSAAPTSCWVTSQHRGWWGACAWCALGIAALVGEETRIVSRLGAEHESVEIIVRDGQAHGDAVVHFAVPAAQWGSDLGYSCATILVFADTHAVDQWCARHRIARGAVLELQNVYELADAWFGDSLTPEAADRDRDHWQALLHRQGLLDAFWDLG
jgi:Alkylmercury lyase